MLQKLTSHPHEPPTPKSTEFQLHGIDIGITNGKNKAVLDLSVEKGSPMPASVKTAISMQQHLFDEANELASELNVSRSKLFVLAIEEFLKKNENKKMLDQINAAFTDSSDEEEKASGNLMKKKQKEIVENDPW